ncbi:MAG: diaminopimelate decarboxylase [Balneolaceae bacterium]
MFTNTVVDSFKKDETPFYYYDLDLLRSTLEEIKTHGISKGFHIHYAFKANNQPRILEEIRKAGLHADCVSGGEVQHALNCNFDSSQIAFAGVGKRDSEIKLGLQNNIFCFNVESSQELHVINELAEEIGTVARVALRLNPNVNAKTHHYITTGLKENKFGINSLDLEQIFVDLPSMKHIKLIGIHFHIGSQIQEMKPFRELCERANQLNGLFEERGFKLEIINVGGGFGIDYSNPDSNAIPDFEQYFNLFEEYINLKPHQSLHFELGRSIVGQCGSLITKVLFTKTGLEKTFAVVDAGMTELLRPALYQAIHNIDVLTSSLPPKKYDVVGPICESSDTFRKDIELAEVKRGDLLAIRSSGAYGEVMKSQYNLRQGIHAVFSDDIS